MVVNKAKKCVRYRGHTKHGWGRKSRHRGSGNRGGRGNSGHGKRGHARKPSHRLERSGPQRVGFKYHGERDKVVTVTLQVLQQKLEAYVSQGLVKKEKDTYVLDVEQLGFNKVLATGRLTHKLKITSPSFTEGAKEKITAAGGSATVSGGSSEETAA